MEQENSQTFDWHGISVTVVFSPEGKPLQECMAEILSIHMAGPTGLT